MRGPSVSTPFDSASPPSSLRQKSYNGTENRPIYSIVHLRVRGVVAERMGGVAVWVLAWRRVEESLVRVLDLWWVVGGLVGGVARFLGDLVLVRVIALLVQLIDVAADD